jgi:hypothetical protein
MVVSKVLLFTFSIFQKLTRRSVSMEKENHFGIQAFLVLIIEGRILDGAVISVDGSNYVVKRDIRIIGTNRSDGSLRTALSYCMTLQYNERIMVIPENVLKDRPWELIGK